MKRKLWGIALVLCLALGLMTSALATEQVPPSPPAETVTEVTTAEDLGTALNNNKSSIKLTDNINGSITVTSTVTLDLNGYKLTNESGSHTITVTSTGNLTIKDSSEDKTGTVDNVSNGCAAVFNSGGTVKLEGGTYTRSKENADNNKGSSGGNSYYTIKNAGTMTIEGGVTVSNVGHFSSMITNGYYNGSAAADGIEGGIVNPKLTINGGTFTGGVNTIKNDDFGILEINGGNFTNVTQHVVMNWNQAEITAGTFETTNSADAVLYSAGDGSSSPGIKGELTITGGTFTAVSGQALLKPYKANAEGKVTKSGSITISGGTFNGTIRDSNNKDTGSIAITGGTFTAEGIDISKYLKGNSTSGSYTLALSVAPVQETYTEGDEITLTASESDSDTTWEVMTGTVEKLSEGTGLTQKYKLTTAGTVTIKATQGDLTAFKVIKVKKNGTGEASLQSWTYDAGASGDHTVTATCAQDQAGASSFVYYDNEGTELDAQPTKAGKYSLKVTWPANDIYNEQTETVYFNIEPAVLTVKVEVADKDYDKTTAATLGEATLAGVIGQDDVKLDSSAVVTAAFKDANVGENKEIVLTGEYKLTGDDAANYTLTQPTGLKANIRKVEATGIMLDKTTLSLYVGGSETLAATLTPENTSETVHWSSSDETIATVDQTGKVTAVAAGKATIYADSVSQRAECKVTVSPLVPATAIKLDKTSITLKKDGDVQLNATVTPANTTDTVIWSTSNRHVASVSETGKVVASGYGTATITAKAGDKVATCTVYVVCGTDKCENYPDVDAKEWYHSAVDYVTAEGIMQGHDTGNFAPEGKLTRAELAQILYNCEKEAVKGGGKPENGKISVQFTDLVADEWYIPAIQWAASNGIVKGDGEADGNTFRPDDPVNREEMVTMLHRYMVKYLGRTDFSEAATGSTDWKTFSDYKDVSDWAQNAFEWAVKYGIINGDDGNKLNPQNTATRAQAAKVMMVAVNY